MQNQRAFIFPLNFKILSFLFLLQIQNKCIKQDESLFSFQKKKSGSKEVQDFSSNSAIQTSYFTVYVFPLTSLYIMATGAPAIVSVFHIAEWRKGKRKLVSLSRNTP